MAISSSIWLLLWKSNSSWRYNKNIIRYSLGKAEGKENLLVGNVVVDAYRDAAVSRNLSSFSSSSSSSPPKMSGSESHVCRLSSCEMCKESNSNLGRSYVGAREDGNCSLRKEDRLKLTCSHPTAHLTRTACLCVYHPWTLHSFLMIFDLFIIVIIRR